MYEKHFAEFFVSEQELKEQIYSTLENLIDCSPEEWSSDFLEYADPKKSTEEIVRNLTQHVPEIKAKKDAFNALYTEESLREVALTLESILNVTQLNFFLLRQLYFIFSNQFLAVRFFIASDIIFKNFTEKLPYDSDKIYLYLIDRTLNIPPEDLFIAARLAEEQIERVVSDNNEGPSFLNFINRFESSIENEIKKNLSEIIIESLFRAYSEAFMNNVNSVNEFLGLDKKLTKADKKKWIESTLKTLRER